MRFESALLTYSHRVRSACYQVAFELPPASTLIMNKRKAQRVLVVFASFIIGPQGVRERGLKRVSGESQQLHAFLLGNGSIPVPAPILLRLTI